jgi:hypothetical protein
MSASVCGRNRPIKSKTGPKSLGLLSDDRHKLAHPFPTATRKGHSAKASLFDLHGGLFAVEQTS